MAAVLRFGSVELHPTQRHLLIRGEAVSVGARAYDVLLALAERSGELVTKQQLLDRVWRGLVVEENNLQVQVAALRKLLGAEAIATIPGLGYRLTLERSDEAGEPGNARGAPQATLEAAELPGNGLRAVGFGHVDGHGPELWGLMRSKPDATHGAEPLPRSLAGKEALVADATPTMPTSPGADPILQGRPGVGSSFLRRWRQLATVAAVAGVVVAAAWLMQARQAATGHEPTEAPLQSVMLVPFNTAPGDVELAQEAQRLTIDVTRALGDTLRDFRVPPSTVAASIAAKTSDVRTMAREAKVRFIVEGELRESGGDAIAILRLFDARDGRQLDTKRHSAPRDRLGEEHDALARRLASQLRPMVAGAVMRATPEVDEAKASAQDLVDRIERLRMPDAAASTREGYRLADEAIRRDPNLAGAWTYRADMRVDMVWNDFDFNGDRERMLADADADSLHSLQLDDRPPAVWVSRGRVLAALGNIEAALAANARAQQIDPTPFYPVMARGWIYYVAGRHAEVLKVADSLPSHIDERFALACAAHVQLGAYDLAVPECERAAAGGDFWLLWANLTAAQAMRGEDAKATQAKARLLADAPSFTISGYEGHRSFRDPAAIARDRETMVAGLRKAGVPE
jgi:DNA-binding winged helix-turn-helix (wHTH) protein/TolB-like protein